MKRFAVLIYGLFVLLLCACGERVATAARTLPAVTTLDEAPLPASEPGDATKPRSASTAQPRESVAPAPATASPTSPPKATDAPRPPAFDAVPQAYVGSRNSEIYHLAGCNQAARIKSENLVSWGSAEAAEADGRTPCKVCQPGSAGTDGDSRQAAEKQPEKQPESGTGEYAYVASRNSTKFHRPDCRHAKQISEENRIGWSSREEAEAAGYEPCKVCNP